MVKYSVIFCILALAIGCSTQNQNKSVTRDDVTLEVIGEKKFELDSLSTGRGDAIQVYPGDNPQYLIFQHRGINLISVFDLNSGELFSKIVLEKEGPNGVGDGITGMHFHNFDSIFLFSILEQKIFLIDSSSRLKDKISLLNENYYTILGTSFPGFFKDSSLYLSCYPHPSRKATSLDYSTARINLSNKSVNSIFALSSEYDRGWWGNHHYLSGNHCYNRKSKSIVLSFPNDHFLHVINENGNVSQYFAGAKKIKALDPVSEDIGDLNDPDKIFQHEGKQGFYYSILFDPWKDVYYRIAFNPVDYQTPFDIFKDASIIVLNKDFIKIGEYYLSDSYALIPYISEKGLHFLNKEKYAKDEDHLTFDVLNLKPL